jgi:hypothetical protein
MIGMSHVHLCTSYFQWWRRKGVHSLLTFWQGKKVAQKSVKALWKLWTSCFSCVEPCCSTSKFSQWHILCYTCVIVSDLSVTENLHTSCSMVSCLSTMQCLITNQMFRIFLKAWDYENLSHPPMFQTLHLVISFCFLVSRNHWEDAHIINIAVLVSLGHPRRNGYRVANDHMPHWCGEVQKPWKVVRGL